MILYTHTHTHSVVKEKQKSRELNFELLRIISAVIIVIFHFTTTGNLSKIESGSNMLLGVFLHFLGKLGVNCFVLISGYFLIDSKFKIKKLIKIVLQVTFYTIIFYSIAIKINLVKWDIFKAINNILPVQYKQYWFITAYISLYLIFPFINKTINHLSQKAYKTLLMLLTIILSIIPSIFIEGEGLYSDLLMFTYMYLVAAYIKRYNINFKYNKLWLLVIMIVSYLFMFFMSLLLIKLNLPRDTALYLHRIYSLPMIVLSIATFMFFKNIKIENNKVITFLSKGTLGVYLIHDNIYMRYIIFHMIIRISNFYNENTLKLIIYVLGWTVIIFTFSIIIDTIRRKVLEEPLFKIKIADKFFEKIDKRMNLED